jgi:enamine deaminase RidA (YjgF/YER057c/UK114 family)
MQNYPASRPSKRLEDLGISLESPAKPVAAYVPALIHENLLFVSGQIPFRDGELLAVGAVPGQVSVETAIECARQCTINGLAAANAALRGATRAGIDDIDRVIRVGCWIACEPGFGEQPRIANGASELLIEVFGNAGRHVRAAVGAIALPLNATVEIEFVFQLNTERARIDR